MSENDYEYLRMRAELLGLPEPEKPVIEPGPPVQLEEEVSCEDDLNLDADAEKFTRTSGGLDEIGNILQTTQKKINRFKTVFGSVTSLLKGRGSADSSTENLSSNSNINESCANEKPKNNDQDDNNTNTSSCSSTITSTRGSAKQVDVESMLSSHINTLDSMVYKADEINAKMNHQNKQMRNFINK